MSNIKISDMTVGSFNRKVLVVDGLVDPAASKKIHALYKNLPVQLIDSDREDTSYLKHFKHDFSITEDIDPIAMHLADKARIILESRDMSCGELKRIYANFNLYGDFQYAHEDGEGWTALYFVNSRWHEDWGGEFQIYPEDGSAIIFSVVPRPGRMVIFDGMIKHRGGIPSKLCFDARISLAIKFGKGR